MWHGENGGKFPPLLINTGDEKKRNRKKKMKEKKKKEKRKREIKKQWDMSKQKCGWISKRKKRRKKKGGG